MFENVCSLCQQRHKVDFSSVTEEQWLEWASKSPSSTPENLCCCCFGMLQFGKPILDEINSYLQSHPYENIFGCQLSIQIPPLMVFRGLIEKLIVTSLEMKEGKFVEVRETLRGLIYRSCVTEEYNDRMPKLFFDVRLDPPKSWELPDDLLRAINRKSSGYKNLKTKTTVNIADVQHFILSTNEDIRTVHSMLSEKDEDLGKEEIIKYLHDSFMSTPSEPPRITIGLKRETLYLVGKYSKETREFGQSPWEANETSVAETICPVVCGLFRSPVDKCLFSASGREDMDVRMLGNGRSFVLQVGDAKSLQPIMDLSALNDLQIDSGDVKVTTRLKFVDKGVMDWLQWSTEQHKKVYRCVVWTSLPLPAQTRLDEIHRDAKNIKVLQKTPLRVLHRRTEHTREKCMYSIELERLNDHFAIVTLQASAGAYIKEFVHGDFGRTLPSFSEIVFNSPVRCDILQLDVLEVEQDEEEDYVPLWERQ
jgi:hypothetical protein